MLKMALVDFNINTWQELINISYGILYWFLNLGRLGHKELDTRELNKRRYVRPTL